MQWAAFAAEAAATGIDPTVAFTAVLAAVVTIIGSVITALVAMTRHSDERSDAASKTSLQIITERLQASEGETLAAEKDRDLWREKAQKLEVDNALLRQENRRLKGSR